MKISYMLKDRGEIVSFYINWDLKDSKRTPAEYETWALLVLMVATNKFFSIV
jgi:hypothetical protein